MFVFFPRTFDDVICYSEHIDLYREDAPMSTYRPRARQLFQYRCYRYSIDREILQNNFVNEYLCIRMDDNGLTQVFRANCYKKYTYLTPFEKKNMPS